MEKFTDELIAHYTDNYPISVLAEDSISDEGYNPRELLQNCIWYRHSPETQDQACFRYLQITHVVGDIINIIQAKFPKLAIRHISIGGSYLFKSRITDLDLTIIVEGSFFSYVEIREVSEINERLPVKIIKMSLMVFGEDDLKEKTSIEDSIETEDYIHTHLCMREGLVFPMRNVTIYGHPFEVMPVDRHNLLIRIKRQLFHAQLMLQGKVDLHRDNQARLVKAIGRIAEGSLYLYDVFPEVQRTPSEVIQTQKHLSASLDHAGTVAWLKEIEEITDNLLKIY